MSSFYLTIPAKKTIKLKKSNKKISTKKTAKKPVKLSKFLSVVKKPELCDSGKYFTKDPRTGKYHAVCPIAKAAVKRGLKFRGGGSPARVIAKKFNLDLSDVVTFTSEWDSRIYSLKLDHATGTSFGKKRANIRKVKLTSHELRTAFKQAVKAATPINADTTLARAAVSTSSGLLSL